MDWERRGVAAAAVTPLSVVALHGLITVQAAWTGPHLGGAAPAAVVPIVVAGLLSWLAAPISVVALAVAITGGALAWVGMLPWGFMPLVLVVGLLVHPFVSGLARALPWTIDGVFSHSRGKALAWSVLAVVMVIQVARLSVFMTDRECTWGSTFPPVPFTVTHMCMASYVHAADLSRRNDPNLYDPKHYPNFGIHEAEEIETSVVNLQGYLDDSFHYPPPFLLLPRSWLSLSNDYLAIRSTWFAVQFFAFVAFAVLVARWIGGAAGSMALWLLPLLLASMPTMFNFQFGQAHLFTVWTAVAAMLAFDARRPIIGGALLAGGIASKIFPALLVLYLLFQRRWREVVWTAIFTVAFGLATMLVTGPAPHALFFSYLLPRLASGEAFSFVTDVLPIATNLSVPGTVWKLDLLGIEGGDALLAPVSWAYTLFLFGATWIAARVETGHAGRVCLWLALLILASLRAPLVPIYAAAPVLWLMTLEAYRVDSVRGWLFFALSWAFINGLPPAPNPTVTVIIFTVAQVLLLVWVLRPLRPARSVTEG